MISAAKNKQIFGSQNKEARLLLGQSFFFKFY